MDRPWRGILPSDPGFDEVFVDDGKSAAARLDPPASRLAGIDTDGGRTV
jgi:hypothetical protein